MFTQTASLSSALGSHDTRRLRVYIRRQEKIRRVRNVDDAGTAAHPLRYVYRHRRFEVERNSDE